MQQLKPNLTVAFLNVCSLRRKVAELSNLLDQYKIDIIMLAETWLSSDISDGEVAIPHYNLERKDRPTRGGGVAVFYRDTLKMRRRFDLERPDLELLWVELCVNGKTHVMGTAYCPPARPGSYWVTLEENVEFAMEGRQESTVVVGDFNVDLAETSPLSVRLQRHFSRLGLVNYVSSPTRVTNQSSTLIDLFFASEPLHRQCEVLPVDVSDHFAILGELHVHDNPVKRSSTLTRRLCNVDWNAFNQDLIPLLAAFPWTQSLDNMTEFWNNAVLQVLDKHAPLKRTRKKQRLPCPWLTDTLIALVRRRNSLHRRLMRDVKNDNLRQLHRSARAEARKLDRRLRNEYFMAASSTTDQRKLWSVINTVTGRQRRHHDPKVSAQELSNAFGEIVTDVHRPHQLKTPHGPQMERNFSAFREVAVADIAACLSHLDVSKATGSDGIPNIVLKHCATTLAPSLTAILNKSMLTGTVPNQFKVSNVTPLHKGGDPLNVRNYRPVSLLPATSRILERAVKVQLTKYLEESTLFPESQFGYRRNHSTEDALVLAVNLWTQAKANLKTTGVVMVDLTKAFDRVKHEALVEELFSLGLHGTALEWFQSYLSDRKQRIKTSTLMTENHDCTRGVPQGSVLGPLLFLLYLRRFSQVLPSNVVHQEFADDIVLHCSDRNPDVVTASLSSAVNNLAAWLEDRGLLLNPSKTQVMFIKPRGVQDVISSVNFQGKPLAVVHTVKYLGMFIDDDLKWTSHVQHVSTKVGKTIAQLWRHGAALSLRARKAWYVSLVQSTITYGSNAFSPGISKQLLSELLKLAKSGVRSVFRLHLPVSTAPLLSKLGVVLPDLIFRRKVIIFVYRCVHNLSSILFSQFFESTSFTRVAHSQLITRGSRSSLLQVPFFRGAVGRSSISFVGSVLWNVLPAGVRCANSRVLLEALLRDLPIMDYPLHY